ncbi:MAG: phycobilisome rod-core linker polypeptide [Synechococcales bacterium]|nr:phycobilisome rod-core linker polypeptide [Synechococcales bacterium]
MALPLLAYNPTSQNQRVAGFEVPGDEHSWIFTTEHLLNRGEMDDLIRAAYRQVFNEQQMTESSRQLYLESQLRSGQISVREFIRGLATSDVFRRRNFDTNNNYRFAQMCVQRLLGREVYNEREKIAWSIVIATKGLFGFVDELLNSSEYLSQFGDHTVPYQRRRILPQRSQGEQPFARMARYDEYYLANLPQSSAGSYWLSNVGSDYRWAWQKNPPASLGQAWNIVIIAGAGIIGLALAAALFHL